MKHTLQVTAKSGTYPVQIGPGLLHQIGHLLTQLDASVRDVFIITDVHVAQCGYLEAVLHAVTAQGMRAMHQVVAPGDASKSLEQAASLYRALLSANVRRDGIIIALGGGVIGDLAGFVAATYLRGIRYIQVPTTLLAHDSSIGGKVGVNLDEGKNLVGAFCPPQAVIYDTDCLTSLPNREWRNGMAEVIKHGLIGDAPLFEALSAEPLPTCPGSDRAADLVARAAQVKVKIVEQDEREQSLRMTLNVGHTIGHAVEKLSDYALGHGEAVAIGIAAESTLAMQAGWLDEATESHIRNTLSRHGLPTELPPYPLDAVLSVLNVDKKHAATGWTFALPCGIGDVRVMRDVSRDSVVHCLETLSQQVLDELS